MNEIFIKKFIEDALVEDIGLCDHSTFNIFEGKKLEASIKIKSEEAILCGIDIAEKVFLYLHEIKNINKKSELKIKKFFNDGDLIKKGDTVLEIYGDAETILKGERVSLNILSYLSGISTKAYQIKSLWNKKIQNIIEISNSNNLSDNLLNNLTKNIQVKLLIYDPLKKENVINILKNIKFSDTRKIIPYYRALVKYAVKVGGLYNHRYNLSDGVMLKENHIKAFGSIEDAIKNLKNSAPLLTKIECEVENFDEFIEAYKAGADVIMLDEFSNDEYKKVANFLKNHNKNFLLEISGNINEEKLDNIINVIIETEIPVDIISIGTNLTLNVKVVDFSMKFK